MNTPTFYATSSIKLYEPLYDLFGVNKNAHVEFTFEDAVKIAGHACPTVAGAFLLAYHGARKLYEGETPIRGSFQLLFKEDESVGVTGVISTIMGSILGASGIGGFKGLGGQFARNNRVLYNQSISSQVAILRTDTNAIVYLDYHPELIPLHQETSQLLSKILNDQATLSEKSTFQKLWNQRLEAILRVGLGDSGIIDLLVKV